MDGVTTLFAKDFPALLEFRGIDFAPGEAFSEYIQRRPGAVLGLALPADPADDD